MSASSEFEPLVAAELPNFANWIGSVIQAKLKYDQIGDSHQAVFDRLVDGVPDPDSFDDQSLSRLGWHSSVIVASSALSGARNEQLRGFQTLWHESLAQLEDRRVSLTPRQADGQLVEAWGGRNFRLISPLSGPASGKLLPQLEGAHSYDYSLRFEPDRKTKKRYATGLRHSRFYYAQIINPTSGQVQFDLSFK